LQSFFGGPNLVHISFQGEVVAALIRDTRVDKFFEGGMFKTVTAGIGIAIVKEAESLSVLRKLRNKIAHSSDQSLSWDDAERFNVL